jgi:hypothetical protein
MKFLKRLNLIVVVLLVLVVDADAKVMALVDAEIRLLSGLITSELTSIAY